MPAGSQLALLVPSVGADCEIKEKEIPSPGPDEILVQIEATALCPADWKVQTFGLFSPQWPVVLGFDGAGTVVETGARVTKFTKGDKVYVC